MAAPSNISLQMELPLATHRSVNLPEQQPTDPTITGCSDNVGNELNPENSDKVYSIIVLRLSSKYARSAPGILKLCQAVRIVC